MTLLDANPSLLLLVAIYPYWLLSRLDIKSGGGGGGAFNLINFHRTSTGKHRLKLIEPYKTQIQRYISGK